MSFWILLLVMAISLNRCLHLRWVQTLKFYFCNYMCSTFSHIFMSGLGCLQYLWILPLFCRCTLLYFLVFKLFPNFLASLCSCIFFVLFWPSLWACFTSCHFFVPLIRFTCLLILFLVYSESYLPIFLLSVCLLFYSYSDSVCKVHF